MIKEIFLNLFFPVSCASCGGDVELTAPSGVCKKCMEKIVPVNTRGCSFCGRPLRGNIEFCPTCISKHSRIDENYTAFYYEGPARELIKKFKYENARYLEKLLSGYLIDLFKSKIKKRFNRGIIVPVPLHRGKLKKRGFNQAELLAVRLSKATGIKLKRQALKRIKETVPQYTRHRRERFENLRGAFRVKRKIVAGRDVILVDDVSTTGATLQQAAGALKSAGAEKITAMTVAHGR